MAEALADGPARRVGLPVQFLRRETREDISGIVANRIQLCQTAFDGVIQRHLCCLLSKMRSALLETGRLEIVTAEFEERGPVRRIGVPLVVLTEGNVAVNQRRERR